MIDLKRILVPTDFSKHSTNALQYATAFAEKFGAELILLHVVQDLALFIPEAVMVAGPLTTAPIDQFRAAAQTALDRVAAGWTSPKVKLRPLVAEGCAIRGDPPLRKGERCRSHRPGYPWPYRACAYTHWECR